MIVVCFAQFGDPDAVEIAMVMICGPLGLDIFLLRATASPLHQLLEEIGNLV